MARNNTAEVRITPSILDRLLDYEPDMSRESPKSRSRSLNELKQAVRRDLEWLMNTRQSPEEIPENLEEVQKSIAIYGLPDFTGIGAKSANEQKRLTKALETALRLFEPRLIDLRISLEPIKDTERTLHFRIEAQLDIDPSPEPVVFDTLMEIGSGEYTVVEK